MGDPVPERFRPALAAVVECLAARDYQGLKRDGIDPHPDAQSVSRTSDSGSFA